MSESAVSSASLPPGSERATILPRDPASIPPPALGRAGASVLPPRRCIWTGRVHRHATELVPVSLPAAVVGGGRGPHRVDVEPAFEADARRWGAFVERHAVRFQVLLGLVLAGLIAGAIWGGPPAVGAAVILLGALVVALPFSTPQTVQWLGIRRAIRVTRGLGIATIVLGGIIALL